MPDLTAGDSDEAFSLASHFIYIITARTLVSGEFGDGIGDVQFVRMPRTHGAIPSQADIIQKDQWLAEVRDIALALADRTPQPDPDLFGGDVLVFVHGYNNTLKDIVSRHDALQESLTRESWAGLVVSFDWPCSNETLNYWGDRFKASKTADLLVNDCIELIAYGQARLNCPTNIHLLGHSTGAYVIMDAFANAQKRGDLYERSWRVAQVAFIAGDVATSTLDFDSDWGKPLFSRIMRLTNYSNGFDYVLAVSSAKRLGTEPRAGRVGLTEYASPKAVNVDCSHYFQTLNPASQAYHNGTWNHSWYIGNQVWARDLAMTLEGRYDRNVLTTRELDNGHLILVDRPRPQYEAVWRKSVSNLAGIA